MASLTSGTLLSLFLRLWNFLILFSSVLLELLKFQYTASLRHRVIGYEFVANLLLLLLLLLFFFCSIMEYFGRILCIKFSITGEIKFWARIYAFKSLSCL